MRILGCLALAFIFFIPIVKGQTDVQQRLLDSLENSFVRDTQYVKWLNQLAYSYWNKAPRKTDSLARISLQLAEKLDYPLGISRANYRIALGQWMLGDYPTAYEFALQQLQVAEEHQLQAEIISAYSMMALIAEDQGLLAQSLEYHQKVLDYRREKNNRSGISSSLNNMASVYYRLDSLDKALELFQESYAIRESSGDKRGMRESLANIAYILNQQGKPKEAMVLIKQSLQVAEELNDLNAIISSNETLGEIYMQLNQLDSAELVYSNTLPLAKELGINKRIIELEEHIAEIFYAKGEYQKAYDHLNAYWTLKDSIEGAASAERLAELEAQYESEKQEKEIAQLQQQNQQSRNLRNIFAISALAALLLVILLGVFYRYRQRKNRELLEAKDLQTQQLEAVNQMKSRFLANISHEFRTPLTLILGPTEQLLSTTEDSSTKQQLSWIRTNGQRLLRLINQLLALSKIEAKEMKLKASQQDVVKFCQFVLSAFESLANQKQLKLRFQAKEEQLFAYFDPEKLEQILNNLLYNSFKFTEEGVISLIVEKENECAKITVADTGTGIHAEQLPHIFERFFQANQDEEIAYAGTGIGLALCKELVELHSGKIEVESELGKGSRFLVWLPLGKAHLQEAEIIAPTTFVVKQAIPSFEEVEPLQQAVEAANEQQSLILVIDDNVDMLDYIQLQLQKKYRVLQATNGQKGLEIAFQELPDLIVSDVMMPGLNGFELCTKLKNDIRTDHIPIILLTARVGKDYKIQGLKIQADEYLQKPFNSRELEVRIENLIAGRKRLRKRFAEQIVFQAAEIAETPQEEVFLQRLGEGIEKNLDDPQFDVNALCSIMNMSKSQLNRKMKAILNKTPNQYIRSYRLEKARQLLKQGQFTISEIAYDVGFSSPAYFTKCFHDEFGYPPSTIL